MQTRNTSHLGDGAYIGGNMHDPHQLWLGANHHENMLVALDEFALYALVAWVAKNRPHMVPAIERGLLNV